MDADVRQEILRSLVLNSRPEPIPNPFDLGIYRIVVVVNNSVHSIEVDESENSPNLWLI